MSSTADRGLLLGILAWQMGFVSRDDVIGTLRARTLDRGRSVGQTLVDTALISPARLALLEQLTAEHLTHHNGDVRHSLAEIAGLSSIRDELAALGDPDLSAALAPLSDEPRDEGHLEATITVVPQPTAGNRFEILRSHARGGLGEVFVARDLDLNREIALKEIHARLAGDNTSCLRFLQEAEITGRLEHPGIVPVYALGQSGDGRPYYAMQFVRGATLKQAIEQFHGTTYTSSDSPASDSPPPVATAARNGSPDLSSHSLEFRQLLSRFVDVCNTMAYAHSRGVLHRDLKPSNIMLGSFGETLVVDWGLAKPLGQSEPAPDGEGQSARSYITPTPSSGSVDTLAGAAVGTPAFMSPEQAVGRLDELGPPSDVYGLGATLYCLLTGRPAFSGGHLGETLQQVERGEFPRPREVQPAVPLALEAICLKAMATRAADRYATAQELAVDVEHWLADESVSAWPEPPGARLARWARRHRTIVASVTALLLAATFSVALGAVLVGREQARTARVGARADAAATLAEAQSRTAGALSGFLIGMFEEPTPYEIFGMRLGRRDVDPAAQALLDRGARQLTEQLDDQPLVKAAMLAAIGRAHTGTGALGKAAPLLEQALAIHRRELPPDDPLIADDLERLTRVYFLQDRPAESERCAREAIRIRRQALDESDPTVVDAKSALALVLVLSGRHPDEMERLWREVLAARRQSLDANDTKIAEATIGLGGVMLLRGDRYSPTDAVPLITEAVKILAAHDETREIGLGITANQGALVLHRLGNNRQAAAIYGQALRRLQRVLGDGHPFTSFALHDYAQTLFDSGQREDARAVFEEIFANYQEHGITFTQRDELAETLARFVTLLTDAGEQPKLEEILRRVLAKQKALTRYRSWNCSTLLARLVEMLKERGQNDELQLLVDDYLATSDLEHDARSLHGAEHCISLVDLLESCGRRSAAATIAGRYADLLRQAAETEPAELASVLNRLGQLLENQGKPARAEALFSEARELLDNQPPAAPDEDNRQKAAAP